MFSRKRIKELEGCIERLTAVVKNQVNDINRLEASEYQLMAKIREMDQLIFSMSQCNSYAEMQPIFAKLKTLTDQRMIDESRRIQNVLIPEMKKAYR